MGYDDIFQEYMMPFVLSCHHIVFGTKGRAAMIYPSVKDEVIRYIGGVCRNTRMKLIEGHAMPEHIHLLVSIPSSLSVARSVNLIKSNSSRWAKVKVDPQFSWQDEYGSFSVSFSQIERTVQYIRDQEQHHKDLSFSQEFEIMLERHEINYDRRYLWRD